MIRASLTAIAVLTLAIPVIGHTDVDLPEIPFEFYTLDNGLEVILHEDHSTPMVGFNVWYHVASQNERPGRSGFAHLFEHMMFQGSEHQDGEFLQTIQGMGGRINGSTSEDRTNYWEIVPPSRLESVLLLEADRMGWLLPAMTEEKFANQQDVVRNERRQSEGRPYGIFGLKFNENFYPKGHPYDHSVIGIHEDLENATLDDVKDFFRTYYTPNNATISISGDFDPVQTKAWVEQYFAAILPGEPIQKTDVWIPELTGEKRVSFQDRVQLTRLSYSWHTPPYYHDGDADLSYATSILGSGRTSRLYRRLVHEEKLAQSVSFRQESQQIVSVAMLHVTLSPDADQAAVERIVDEELSRFAAEGPTARELERVQNQTEARFVTGVQRIGSWGGINDRLNRYNHYVGTPDYFQQDFDRHVSRTAETVRSQAERWLGGNRMLAVISPFKDVRSVEVADVNRSELPTPGKQKPFSAPELHRTRLESGMQLVVMEKHDLPLVRMELMFRSGATSAPAGQDGLCDVTAGMLLEGTRSHDKFEYQDELDFLGSNVSYSTDQDRSTLTMQTLRKNLSKTMDLVAEALLEPAFDESEFVLNRDRRVVNVRQEADQARTVAAKVARRVMFGDEHPYSRSASGTVASLEAMAVSDVKAFADSHFVPGNATMILVGDITLAEAEREVARALRKWEGDAPAPTTIAKPEPRSERTVYLVDKPGDSQSTVSIAQFGIPRNHDDWESIYVVNRMLGGTFSSRLNLNLREDKGYTYGARGGTQEAASTSLYTLGARVQTEVTAPALVEFMAEYEGGAGARPFTADELTFAKDSIVLSYSQDFETIGELAGVVGDQVTYGLTDDDYARYPERIAAVDLATANDVAADYLAPGTAAIIVVGDLKKIEESIRELNLGPIRYCDRDGNLMDTSTDYSSR